MNLCPAEQTKASAHYHLYFECNFKSTFFNANTIADGTYNFTYIVSGVVPCADDNSSVSVEISSCTGIEENTSDNVLSIYPNPSNGKFTLVTNGVVGSRYVIEITNVHGKSVVNESQIQANSYIEIDINKSAGVYFVLLRNEEGKVVARKRIVVN